MKRILDNFEEYLGGVLFGIMFVIMILQIFSRQILGTPLTWTEELARLIFVYVALIGVILGIKHSQHVGIDIVSNKFPPKLKFIMDIFKSLIIFIIIILLIKVGYKVSLRKSALDLVSLGISSKYLYGSLPVFGLLMLLRFAERFYMLITKRRDLK